MYLGAAPTAADTPCKAMRSMQRALCMATQNEFGCCRAAADALAALAAVQTCISNFKCPSQTMVRTPMPPLEVGITPNEEWCCVS
jgi:hypothetical protein